MAFAAVNAAEAGETLDGDTKMSPKPRYKSYRKKYNKERHKFREVMETSNRQFEEELRLQKVARRLKEHNDQLLDLLLTVNSSTLLPPHLQFDISSGPPSASAVPALEPDVPSDLDAETSEPSYTAHAARSMLLEARSELESGAITQNDYDAVLNDVRRNLGGPHSLPTLESSTQHTSLPLSGLDGTPTTNNTINATKPLPAPLTPHDSIPPSTPLPSSNSIASLSFPFPFSTSTSTSPENPTTTTPLTFLTPSQEDEYLSALDASLSGLPAPKDPAAIDSHPIRPVATVSEASLRNPVSVYNWLRKHQPHVFLQDVEKDKDTKDKDPTPETKETPVSGSKSGGGGGGQPERKGRAKRNSSVQQAEILDDEGNVIGGFGGDGSGAAGGGGGAGATGRGKRKREDDGSYRPKGGGGGGGRAKKRRGAGRAAAGGGEGD
ncbi:hypothetical protein MMC10_002958 [Thelotrema lepadinum]|nr:hypothetical protein [Thelotrema lepadinum]